MVKHDASGKKGQLLCMCCKRIFDLIKANLAEIQPKNQISKKRIFLQKAPGVNGLKQNEVLNLLSKLRTFVDKS